VNNNYLLQLLTSTTSLDIYRNTS